MPVFAKENKDWLCLLLIGQVMCDRPDFGSVTEFFEIFKESVRSYAGAIFLVDVPDEVEEVSHDMETETVSI